MTHYERIVNELEALAAAEGFQLPAPARLIALHELEGFATDLQTGELICAAAEIYLYPTERGRAWLRDRTQGGKND